MKKIVVSLSLMVCSSFLFAGCSSDSGEQESSPGNETSVSTTEVTESSEISQSDKVDKINENWYASDSKYATMEPIKNTVNAQMDELGIDDPVRAILVNNIQSYLSESGQPLEATEINQNLQYTRSGMYIDINYNGKEPNSDMVNLISDDLLNISGHKYTIE